MSLPVTVAIFDASDDSVGTLEMLLFAHGFNVVNGHVAQIKRGLIDFVAFIQAHQPKAVIWDISPPYAENWAFFQLLRSSRVLHGRCVIVTTTDKQQLDAIVGGGNTMEIVGKPYDLDLVLHTVRECVSNA